MQGKINGGFFFTKNELQGLIDQGAEEFLIEFTFDVEQADYVLLAGNAIIDNKRVAGFNPCPWPCNPRSAFNTEACSNLEDRLDQAATQQAS